jgi:ketosteroid isomerase-like protein
MSGTEFEEFFETYAERYMASDADAITAMYEAPFLAVREGRAIHLVDRDAVREHLAGLTAAYRNAGATRAAIAALDVTPLGNPCALATVRWNAGDDDGALVRDFATSYRMLRTESGDWRILSYTNHQDSTA